MVNKLSQTIIDFNKLDKKNVKAIVSGGFEFLPDENGILYLNGSTSGGSTGGTVGGTVGGTAGGTTGGTAGGTVQNPVPQLPSNINLFSGLAVGNIFLSGPTPDYSNVQDGLLITLASESLEPTKNPNGSWFNYGLPSGASKVRFDIFTIGLTTISIPKEQLIVGNSFDISGQLSQYIGKNIQAGYYVDDDKTWLPFAKDSYSVASFGGTTISVLPNATLDINLTLQVKGKTVDPDIIPIPVIQVNDYKK